jgi:hypothetical protein
MGATRIRCPKRRYGRVYRDGEKIRSEDVSSPIPANEGFDAAEEDLRENVEEFIKRFEKWHGVKDRSDL